MATADTGKRIIALAWLATAWLLKLAALVVTVLSPLMGMWVASSLAAYENTTPWVALLVGLLLFPVLPFGWEAFARHRRDPSAKRILRRTDRLVLRTLCINLVFLTALFGLRPQAGFQALATRGDWMLDGHNGPTANAVRNSLFAVTERLEWIYNASQESRYSRDDERSRHTVDDDDDDGADEDEPTVVDAPSAEDSTASDEEPETESTSDGKDPLEWPVEPTVHPVVRAMPSDVETDYKRVARYIGERVSDPRERVKALHDWVATRIAYDVPALTHGIPSQAPERVFAERKGVCAGYALLLEAMAQETGDTVVYISGHTRSESHAWNAAKIDGSWYLMDPTWNAGFVSGTTFERRYGTSYLFTPPELFLLNHLPGDESWQLLEEPITQAEFMRQPQLRPTFFQYGLKLLTPRRSQISVSNAVTIRFSRPSTTHTMVRFSQKGDSERQDCQVSGRLEMEARCALPRTGEYEVQIFASNERYGTYEGVGHIDVNRR